MSTDRYHIRIIGGGIVGLATGYCLSRNYPGCRVAIFEKEPRLAAHQTQHNSGVIHSGIYYRPGSARARTSVRGGELLLRFCDEHAIRYELCGKVVVATDEQELPALEELYRRGVANGVPDLALLDRAELREVEPHSAGVRALHVRRAGIVNYGEVASRLAACIVSNGGAVHTGARVEKIRSEVGGVVLETSAGAFPAGYLIACAGLYSDRLARKQGEDPKVRVVPFRGEYYELRAERCELVRGLIYPLPDARFPFLGVHFTRKLDGGVEAGPNAVLALHREGYTKGRLNLRDLGEVLAYPGFWRMARRYWPTGWDEMVRSFSKRAFVKALARLVPEIAEADLRPGGAGVRAQALARSGDLLDDFLIVAGYRSLHVCNAPSPAATASLAIAEEIVQRAEGQFEGLGTAVGAA